MNRMCNYLVFLLFSLAVWGCALQPPSTPHLPEDEHFTVTPHTLRHTLLRRITEDERYGIHMAMAASGHKSDKYIWTYTQPSDDELEELD